MKKIPTRQKRRLFLLSSGFAASCLVLALYFTRSDWFEFIDYKLYDICLKNIRKTVPPDTGEAPEALKKMARPVLVDIDGPSLAHVGQWPWPRIILAGLIEKIHGAGALATGIDILMDSPDRTSAAAVQKMLEDEMGLHLDLSGLPPEARDNDQYLARVLKRFPTVLGYYFHFAPGPPPTGKKGPMGDDPFVAPLKLTLGLAYGIPPAPDLPGPYLFRATGAAVPLPVLQNPSPVRDLPATGFMNASPDRDGTLRRVPLLISYKGRTYPHLALATLLTAVGQVENALPRFLLSGDPVLKLGSDGTDTLKIGNTTIPLGKQATLLINYQGPSRTFPYMSALDVLTKKPDELAPLVNGRIVFIGSTAPALKDLTLSPLDAHYPGLEINATVVNNILTRNFISRPAFTTLVDMLLILFCGGITTLLVTWSGPKLSLPVTLLLGPAVFLTAQLALARYRIQISAFYPLLSLAFIFPVLNLIKFVLTEKDKRFYRKAFGKYVSRTVVDTIIASPGSLSLAGEEKEVTILFSDIRGFSGISETIPPEQVTRILHDYFTPLSRVVINHQGTMDKFIGDAMMCFWNAPLNVADHQEKGLVAAVEMKQALARLNETFQARYGLTLKTGIGLHSGICRVGNMGSEDLFDYTVIGDNVNLASRIEGLTKFYGLDILFSSRIAEKISCRDHIPGRPRILEVDRVRVKGKAAPVQIHTLLFPGPGDEKKIAAEQALFYKGLEHYRNRDFSHAAGIFQRLEERCPGYRPYSIYRKRAEDFTAAPPPRTWDGVFNHTTK